MKKTIYPNPIIILGPNHSGTRAVVDILTALGSNPGDNKNEWKENKLFLQIHQKLIDKYSNKGWDKTIFNNTFIKNHIDDRNYVDDIKRMISEEIHDSYEDFGYSPWHFKCPTSALFLPTWKEVFPHAKYIAIKRKPEKIAESLMNRKQFLNPFKALKFVELMNEKIYHSIDKDKVLVLKHHNLENSIDEIAAYLNLRINDEKREKAIDVIRGRKKPQKKKLKTYLYRKYVKISIYIVKLFKSF